MPAKKIRDLKPPAQVDNTFDRLVQAWTNTRYLEYKNLLMNAVTITGLEFNKERFVKSCLIEKGAVGYDQMADKWATVYGSGLNELGNPTKLTFTLRNRTSYRRDAFYEPNPDGAYMILALPDRLALSKIIRDTAAIESICDSAIKQNLIACQTPFIVVARDKDTMLSIEQAIRQREEGQPVIITSSSVSEALKGVETVTPYMVDKFVTYRDQERDRLLNKLGIMSANINKRERVQVGEVNATVGQCMDYIYLIIDTFNKQMETYGLPFKMELNESLEELYTNEPTEPQEPDDSKGVKDE